MIKFTRNAMRSFIGACAFAACGTAIAQTYPAKPIRWFVPSAPAGAFDILTRALVPGLSPSLGQPLLVDNRGGAAGVLGMELAAKAAPDGYTLLTAGTSQLIFNKFFYAKLPYDPQKDYAPISMLADLPLALYVHTSVPVKSLQELIKYAKANPNKLNYGSAGVGHVFHLGMVMLSQRTGIQVTHVPYKGIGPAQQEVFAGRIELMFSVASSQMLSQVKAGKLRVLVGGSDKRLSNLPDIPSFEESGIPDMDVPNWIGLVAPAGTPPDIVARLNREVARAIASPEMAKVYESWSYVQVASTPEQFGRKINREIDAWGPVIKSLGITLE
ncbi:MAG: tripartite tricarboxylate transporter substrate binding protein [Pseudomonadota bacterium]